ncbi:hypothetical protein HELRODRAFT_180695 [Helobdella robusta]|uniref:Apple domain-containing protein n=1 Tax=Helobdella robusta TaxID=6412 RepID=T1FG65_HELRO|nr:hypothetical protein HELRODRAFT_180695 [Helobdella robusta]ESN93605.1 hypothetical protein HELRODRAFT_180695 [Helobdella robusta]
MVSVKFLFLVIFWQHCSAQSCSWMESPNTNTPGGSFMQTYNTLNACKAGCSSTNVCQNGFDWDWNVNGCFFSTSMTKRPANNVSHFDLTCTSSGTPTPAAPWSTYGCGWTQYSNTNTLGGILKNPTNLSDCQASYLASNYTYGLDWDITNSRCYFSTTSMKQTGSTGVDHYENSCVDPPNCYWIVSNDTFTQNGRPMNVGNDSTYQACQAACNSFNPCPYGFDYNPSNPVGQRCFNSTGTYRNTMAGIFHFQPSDGCVNTCNWRSTKDKNTRGGIEQSFNTIETCQSACLNSQATNYCENGFDWNSNLLKCWFSTSSTTYDAVGIYHYDCTKSSCIWSSSAGTKTLGGSPQSYTTLEACKSNCLNSPDTNYCFYGFDWDSSDTATTRCFFSTGTNYQSANRVDHYYCEPDKCTWPVMYNTKTLNGNPQAYTSLADCRIACETSTSTNNCQYGIDWDESGLTATRCWFSTSVQKSTASQVNHYDCNRPSACGWMRYQNRNTLGGRPMNVTNDDDVTQCQQFCKNYVTCSFGFDYNPDNPTGQKCFMSVDSTLYNATGISHYQLSSACYGLKKPDYFMIAQSPTTAQYPTVTQLSSVAQFQTAAQNLAVGLCTWYTKENTNTQGGLEQPLVFTLDQCQATCISSNNCLYGFDWDEKNSRGIKCWLSTMNVQREAAGVLHYFISCPLPVDCVWNKYPSTQTKGGIPIPIRPPTNDTLDNCKDYCYNNRLLCTMG